MVEDLSGLTWLSNDALSAERLTIQFRFLAAGKGNPESQNVRALPDGGRTLLKVRSLIKT